MSRHKNVLREIAKFAAGMIAADFLAGLWLYNSQLIPLNFAGIIFTSSMIIGWMVFDVVLLAILIHYAWHADVHTPSITQKTFFIIVGIIIGIIALAHLLRLIFGVTIAIGPWEVPFWLSWIGTIAAAFISYSSFRFAVGKKRK